MRRNRAERQRHFPRQKKLPNAAGAALCDSFKLSDGNRDNENGIPAPQAASSEEYQ